MKSEVDLQSEIIKGWEAAGGPNWGKKLSNAWTSGIPDLMLSGWVLNRYDEWHCGPWIIEIKKITKLPMRDGTRVSFDHPLTALQNQCLKDLRKGGTMAGWVAVHRTYAEDGIYVGHVDDDRPTLEEFYRKCIIRKRGQPWSNVFPTLLDAIRAGLR